MHRDSTWVSIELINLNLAPVLRSDKSTVEIKANLKEAISFAKVGPASTKVGKIYVIKGDMYYPVITSVTDKKQIIGYIISWQRLKATPKAVAQLSQLVGSGAAFYLANTDGSLWTDMIKPVSNPPFNINNIGKIVEYNNPGNGDKMIASKQIIALTDWFVIVEFNEKTVLQGIDGFVNLIFITGLALTAIGIFLTWVMSRNITKPLNQLTAASTSIAEGDYSTSVPINVFKSDELGKLANAFNIMRAQVNRMHQDLEEKVEERTSQLENVNKELEAFSYSVSHDLRTPLRAINGYSMMLKEDYEDKLDAEGNRIIRNIITNAKMMGQLIDDLLSFSRLGKKDLAKTHVDMKSLAPAIVKELLQQEPENKYLISIDLLPAAEADQVMVKQVLINLISNAIKYSSKRADPEIKIGFKREGARTIYYVRDNGVGFNMAYADKLFGVFQRLHSQEEFEGSGVGLALVKRIIDKHKGEIWAEGLEGNGATFYFTLP